MEIGNRNCRKESCRSFLEETATAIIASIGRMPCDQVGSIVSRTSLLYRIHSHTLSSRTADGNSRY